MNKYYISIYPVKYIIEKLSDVNFYRDFLNNAYHQTLEVDSHNDRYTSRVKNNIQKIPQYDQYNYYVYNHRNATLYFYSLDELYQTILYGKDL